MCVPGGGGAVQHKWRGYDRVRYGRERRSHLNLPLKHRNLLRRHSNRGFANVPGGAWRQPTTGHAVFGEEEMCQVRRMVRSCDRAIAMPQSAIEDIEWRV